MKRVTCPHCGMEFSPSEHTGAEADKLLLFTAFWDVYPKKIQKPAAQRAWLKINPSEPFAEIITESVNLWKQNPAWKDITYVPYPATFLNNRMFEDVPPCPAKVAESNSIWDKVKDL